MGFNVFEVFFWGIGSNMFKFNLFIVGCGVGVVEFEVRFNGELMVLCWGELRGCFLLLLWVFFEINK